MAKASKNITKAKPQKKAVPKSIKTIAPPNPVKRRRLNLPNYQSFRLNKKIRTQLPLLSGPITLSTRAIKLLWNNRFLFGSLTAIYAFLSLVLVRGFTSTLDVNAIKEALNSLVGGDLAGVTVTASLFGIVLGTLGTVGTSSGSTYQSFLLIVMSLATIWALRSTTSGQVVRVRDTFYKGLYPLAVFLIVLMAIGVQLLPLAVGSWLYGILVGGGIAVTLVEKAVCVVLLGLFAILSFYMVTSSLFALFISTIPDMTPMRALKSARQLVLHRRWQVLSRIVGLLFVLPLLSAAVMLPFIILVPVIAEWVFFILSMLGAIFILTYMYLLYKELLNE